MIRVFQNMYLGHISKDKTAMTNLLSFLVPPESKLGCRRETPIRTAMCDPRCNLRWLLRGIRFHYQDRQRLLVIRRVQQVILG